MHATLSTKALTNIVSSNIDTCSGPQQCIKKIKIPCHSFAFSHFILARATVMNLFRIPLNFIVILVLLQVGKKSP